MGIQSPNFRKILLFIFPRFSYFEGIPSFQQMDCPKTE